MYKYKGHTPENKETRAQKPKTSLTKAQKQQAHKQELNKIFNKAKNTKERANKQPTTQWIIQS